MFPDRLPPPLPHDTEAAAAARERLRRRFELVRHQPWSEAARTFLEDPTHGPLLDAILAASPFLLECLLQDPEIAARLMEAGPEGLTAEVLRTVREAPIGARARLMRALRHARRRLAFAVAWADLAGLWDLERVVRTLSDFADACVQRAVEHLLVEAAGRGEIALADREAPAVQSGLVVLAMGKLGAFELNYSSDIDLVVLYDPERLAYRGDEAPRAFAVRLARNLGYMLEQRTAEGYVFRTDFRLRPHLPGHPLAFATTEAEAYYERHGQNWERAALIKARAHAGDIEAGEALLTRLSPFIWRKYLDYAAIRDIHAIKRQIHAHRGFAEIRVLGHDLKVGRGGIREIEFFVQTQQLILGGRHPELRSRRTREALARLAAGRWIGEEVREELDRAYVFLRSLEHRLQMRHDRQTQRLPERPEEFARLAAFCGSGDATAFEQAVRAALATVERHYAALFEHEVELGVGGSLVFTGTEDDPETLATLRRLGFREPSRIAARIREWHHGAIRATRSARARELLTELVPAMLEALARQPDPDSAFALLDEFLTALPAGVQIFSLLHANDRLLRLLADLVGAAPALARTLAQQSELFEAMLEPDFFEPLPHHHQLAAELARALEEASGLEELLETIRRLAHARRFQAGLHLLLGIAPVREVQETLTAIAEVVLETLLPYAHAWLRHRHGDIEGGRFAVVGLGKLGSRELTIGSDLDLVFVFDAPLEARSTGPQPLAATSYYARLGQRLVSALTAPTRGGRLYEIDLRLRPSGNVGPLAVSLAAFERYQRETAATWEHQALTRARPVAGDAGLKDAIARVIDQVVARPRDPAALARDIRRMRERIFREHSSEDPWQLKHARGGLVELEFTAQYLQLAHAHRHPALRRPETRRVLAAAGAAGLLAPERARELVAALDLMHALQAVLRLSGDRRFRPEVAPSGLREALVRTANRAREEELPMADFAELQRRLVEAQAAVRATFDELCPPSAHEEERA